MSEAGTVETWGLLRDFGFEPDADVISDVKPGLICDFGNFKLSASCLVDMRFSEIVMFHGVLVMGRNTGKATDIDTIAEVSIEMPRQVASREQCAAWIVWHLDQAVRPRLFTPMRSMGWVEEGRNYFYLLPWLAELKAYEQRPCCSVDLEWMRLAMKKMRNILNEIENEEPVIFSFDGSILIIRFTKGVVAVAADGKAWTKRYVVQAENLRDLPKRIMIHDGIVDVWELRLGIGRHRYGILREDDL